MVINILYNINNTYNIYFLYKYTYKIYIQKFIFIYYIVLINIINV